jgi:ABC-type transport system substrate-binding protein
MSVSKGLLRNHNFCANHYGEQLLICLRRIMQAISLHSRSLVEIDADGRAVPELAESREASSDAKKWIFRLRKGVFTGGYMIKSFEPGVRAFAVRNPNYFKSDRAWFDEVEILGINDVNARTNALKTGQIDVMNRCDLKTVHLFKRMRGIQVMRQDGFKHFTFAMRTDTAPYDNNDVRLALKYAVDREQMVKTILRG